MLLVSTWASCPWEIIDLIVFHLKSKAEQALVSLVTSKIILFLTVALLARGFINVLYI